MCGRRKYEVTPDELHAFLADRVARWWLPDDFAYLAEIPRTSVGKFDKRVLRGQLKPGALDVRAIGGPIRRHRINPVPLERRDGILL